MTSLAVELAGVAGAEWEWVASDASVPAGVVVDHGDHEMLVSWVARSEGAVVFTLDSLVPLTVVELVWCRLCGVEGRIEQGAWLPLEQDGA